MYYNIVQSFICIYLKWSDSTDVGMDQIRREEKKLWKESEKSLHLDVCCLEFIITTDWQKNKLIT